MDVTLVGQREVEAGEEVGGQRQPQLRCDLPQPLHQRRLPADLGEGEAYLDESICGADTQHRGGDGYRQSAREHGRTAPIWARTVAGREEGQRGPG